MARWWLIWLLGVGMAAGQVATTPEAAQRLVDRGHADEALTQLAALDQKAPGVAQAKGQAFYALGRYAEAEAAFASAAAQDPKDLQAIQMRGLSLFRLGRPAAAIPLLEQAQQFGPETRVDPAYVLALCYLDTKRYEDARRTFALQYGFAPESAGAYLLAARMLLRRDYVPIAAEYAKKALTIDPALPLAHLLLGEVALYGNHLEEATAEFELERARNPLNGAVYDRLGDAYSRAGEYQKASQSLQRALLLEPTATGPYLLLGKVLLKQGAPANAMMYLERARTMDPGNFMTHNLLGQAYRAVGRTDDARRETELGVKLQAQAEPKVSAGAQAGQGAAGVAPALKDVQ